MLEDLAGGFVLEVVPDDLGVQLFALNLLKHIYLFFVQESLLN